MEQEEFDRLVRETALRMAQEQAEQQKQEAARSDLVGALSPRAQKILRVAHLVFIVLLTIFSGFMLVTGYSHWTRVQNDKAALHEQVTHPGGPAPATASQEQQSR